MKLTYTYLKVHLYLIVPYSSLIQEMGDVSKTVLSSGSRGTELVSQVMKSSWEEFTQYSSS